MIYNDVWPIKHGKFWIRLIIIPEATPSLITHTGDLAPTTSVAHQKMPQATLSPPTRCLPTSPSSTVSPVIQEILTYPTVEERVNNNTKRKSVKRAIPRFMNSEAAMKPCSTKNWKRLEKLQLNRRNWEKKKRKIEKECEKKNKVPPKKRKVAKAKKDGQQWRVELSVTLHQENDNICKMCFINYEPSDDKNMPWVQCEDCKGWMHIWCDTTQVENDERFFLSQTRRMRRWNLRLVQGWEQLYFRSVNCEVNLN